MTTYADLAHLDEDKRIKRIGDDAMSGLVVGVLFEAYKPEKIARYLEKLAQRYPEVMHGRCPSNDPLFAAFKFTRKVHA